MKLKKVKSLSIFFPFYNDQGTVEKAITDAYKYGEKLANKLEVIAIHGGKSEDGTWAEIKKMKARYPSLKVIDKRNNKEGYAVIKYGLLAAKKEWVFYTDGDLQYSLDDLPNLVAKTQKADLINGFKKNRQDIFLRRILGESYRVIVKSVFKLPIRDLDCDFRLIRNKYLKKIRLVSRDSSVLLELILKLQKNGARFAEVPVRHYRRVYGKSNFHWLRLLKEKIVGDLKVYYKYAR